MTLFGDVPTVPPKPEVSADRARTLRQARDVATGFHPLLTSLYGANHLTRIHPEASRDASRDDPKGLPFTCGSCVHRELGGPWDYPKCWLGYPARVSAGPATDLRAWWPACRDYEARP